MNSAKVALITGSSSGFGRVTAETLARHGYRVFASMRNIESKNAQVKEELHGLAAKEGLALEVIELDVGDEQSVARAVESIVERTGRIDVLVNNAGVMIMGPTEAVTVNQAERLFNTNFFGPVRMNRAVLPHMRRQGSGLVIHIGSIVGRVVFPLMGIYAASKFALEALAETYRYELSGSGIDSVIIEPGMYPTAMPAKMASDQETVPHDSERIAPYQPVIQQIQSAMGSALSALETHPNGPQPQAIADQVLALVELPYGQRPARVVTGSLANPFDQNGEDRFTRRLNGVADQIQGQLMEQMGFANLLRPAEQKAA